VVGEYNRQHCGVSLEVAIEVAYSEDLVVVDLLIGFVLGGWAAQGVLAFDEEVRGTRIHGEFVGETADIEVESETDVVGLQGYLLIVGEELVGGEVVASEGVKFEVSVVFEDELGVVEVIAGGCERRSGGKG
jgi:hypothetical protein